MAVAGLAFCLELGGCATAPRPAPPSAVQPVPEVPPVPAPPANLQRDPRRLMIASAESMLGQPYRYGGASPGGFDCSGLVVYAATRAGLRVPRTAQEQLAVGIPVALPELEPGDLVFMNLTGKGLHVGILLEGERFIHAPSSGGRVRIDSLRAPPYAQGFLGARRLVGSQG